MCLHDDDQNIIALHIMTCMHVVCVVIRYILDVRLVDAPTGVGVTQEEGHTGFPIHLPSAVLVLIFLAGRIQPFLSLVDREVEFCVTHELIVLGMIFFNLFYFHSL